MCPRRFGGAILLPMPRQALPAVPAVEESRLRTRTTSGKQSMAAIPSKERGVQAASAVLAGRLDKASAMQEYFRPAQVLHQEARRGRHARHAYLLFSDLLGRFVVVHRPPCMLCTKRAPPAVSKYLLPLLCKQGLHRVGALFASGGRGFGAR